MLAITDDHGACVFAMFDSFDSGRLLDHDLVLGLVETSPGNATITYVPAYTFIVRLVDRSVDLGRIVLRVGNTDHVLLCAGHLGYTGHPEHCGHRYAARACRLLVPLARRHGLRALWVTCNPENTASRRTCELAGGKLVEVMSLPEDTELYQRGERRTCRNRIDLMWPPGCGW